MRHAARTPLAPDFIACGLLRLASLLSEQLPDSSKLGIDPVRNLHARRPRGTVSAESTTVAKRNGVRNEPARGAERGAEREKYDEHINTDIRVLQPKKYNATNSSS